MMQNNNPTISNSARLKAVLKRVKTRQRQQLVKKQNKVKDSQDVKSMGISSGKEEMSKDIYEAALEGNVTIVETESRENLLRKTFVMNNILHVAFRSRTYGKAASFASEVVSIFPQLLSEPNSDGDTPLHLAVELREYEYFVREVCGKLTDDVLTDDMKSPLRQKNLKDNTPLHVALIRNQPEVALIMLEKDPSLATVVNKSSEAPLHLAIKYFPDNGHNDRLYPVKWRNYLEKKKLEFIEMMREKEPSWDYPAEEYDIEEYNNGNKENKMIEVIIMLLEKASFVAGWKDESGMTPLHLAASLDKAFNLVVISYIIHCCPQSMEVCDSSGKTILHHLVNRVLYIFDAYNCLYVPRLNLLRDHQDHDGNTPLHLAIIKKDYIMIQLMQVDQSDSVLKNKASQSIMTLVEQGKLTKFFNDGSLKGLMMTEGICRGAECGDVFTLERLLLKHGMHYHVAKDSNGKNLIHKLFQIEFGHVVIPYDYNNFIETLLDMSPHFVSDTDKNSDTPLHILAQLNLNNIKIHLATGVQDHLPYLENPYKGPKPDDPIFFSPSYIKNTYDWKSLGSTTFLTKLIEQCYNKSQNFFKQGCSMKNAKGNTPLHEAIAAKNFTIFSKLAQLNTEATTLVNNHGETILHLLATVDRDPTSPIIGNDLLRDIVNNTTKNDQNLLDKDGLTPFMRAIEAGNIVFAKRMCSLCPKIAQLKGSEGETFWHLLAILPIKYNEYESFFTNEGVRNLLKTKDKNEDTALHIAIDRLNFDAAKLFLSSRMYDRTQKLHEHLLEMRRKDGKTPSDLIGELPYLPQNFEDFIWEDSTFIGTRSIWGIPTTQTATYSSTTGVIAALFATITFTAAFTVPGGLNPKDGTPLLISVPTFQVFMISNVLAMCLSVTVLFCLFCIMATGSKSKSVVLLDFSIMFLLASFGFTLLTFMTGLYAITHLVNRWVTILSLVLCCLFLLLMLICLVGYLVIPSRKAILKYIEKGYRYVKDAFRYGKGLCNNGICCIKECCPWSNSPRPEVQSSMPL